MCTFHKYRQTSNISRTISMKLFFSRLALQLSLSNPLKPSVMSRMRMYIFCFSNELEYSWERVKGTMPAKAYLSDRNRVLHIPKVQTMDQGSYHCTCVRRGSDAQSDSATVILHVDGEQKINPPVMQDTVYMYAGETRSVPFLLIPWLHFIELSSPMATCNNQQCFDEDEWKRCRFKFFKTNISVCQVSLLDL